MVHLQYLIVALFTGDIPYIGRIAVIGKICYDNLSDERITNFNL
jgi:hypothetical protein